MIKNLYKYFALITFCVMNSASGQIIETASLEPFEIAAEQAGKDTLILFDVVEVLMVAEDQILSPLYKNEFRSIKQEIAKTHSLEEQEKLFSIILKNYETVIVDPQLIGTLEHLKRKNIKVIGLTSGYTGKYGIIDNREDIRLERLKKIGFDFKYSFPNLESIVFSDVEGAKSEHPPMFKDGILFACRLSKAEILKAFLEKINYKPKKIIFSDNQLKNIKALEAYCATEGIEFIGFHYVFSRSKDKTELNKDVIEYQLKTLKERNIWLNDKEALEHLSKK